MARLSAAGEGRADFTFEIAPHAAIARAQRGHADDDRQRDQAGDEGVFDGDGPGAVAQEIFTPSSRSRSSAASGRSALSNG